MPGLPCATPSTSSIESQPTHEHARRRRSSRPRPRPCARPAPRRLAGSAPTSMRLVDPADDHLGVVPASRAVEAGPAMPRRGPADGSQPTSSNLAEGGARDRPRPVRPRGAANAGQCSFAQVRSASSVGGSAVVGHDARPRPRAPLRVGAAGDRHVGHPGRCSQHRLDGLRPHVLAAGDHQVVAAPVTSPGRPRRPCRGRRWRTSLGVVGVVTVPVRVRSSDAERRCSSPATDFTSTPSSGPAP